MKSVLEYVKTEEFPRIRVGIGRDKNKDTIQYVIGSINKEEREILDKGSKKAADAISDIIKHGIDIAMNKYN